MPRKRFNVSQSLGRAAILALAAAATATAQGPGGPPGGGPGGPGGFGPGTFFAPAILKLADADKDGRVSPEEAGKAAADLVQSADVKKAGAIDAEALGKAINKIVSPPDFGGGDGPPPGDFGPGNFLAPQILGVADADKDGKLSPDEAARAAEKFIRAADADKKGSLDSAALGSAINRLMGPPPGMGGPGGPMGQERKLLKEFDKDGDGHLNAAERKAARDSIKAAPGGGRRFGPPGGMGGGDEKGTPGPKVAKSDAPKFDGKPLYDPAVLRTLFLDFEGDGWESEMAAFYNSDVEMPATLTVDGRTYKDVGVHFRGASSYFAVAEGSKRSLNISLDDVHSGQTLEGYKTLNLLNAHEDATFLHTVLYFHIARNYLPAPKANFVKVVINGESWGLYTNAQQFDKIFTKESFGTTKGARWKVKGNPGARGGLEYLGEDAAPYKQRYTIKTGDNPKDWARFIELCKILNQTPPEKLEEALKPILDIEGVLWFLALDNALINGDGYWVRSSDYNIFLDPSNKFHIIPHDANETFGPAMMMGFGGPGGGRGGPGGPGGPGGGPGGPGGPGGGPGGPGGGPGRPGGPGGPGRGPGGGGGVDLDPLIGMDDAAKPLRSKLLAVPSLRAKYLAHVRTIATDWLDWEKLGPVVAQYRAVIDKELQADTRKLMSYPAYLRAVGDEVKGEAPRGRTTMSLKEFAAKRRKYLLENADIKKLD